MTPQERRGKRLFLVLATLIILEKIAGIVFVLAGSFAEVNWFRSVIQPIWFALAVALLWLGENWLRWLVGVACVFTGALFAYVSVHVLVALSKESAFLMQVVRYPIGLIGLFGLFYVVAGLLFLLSPSMRAFFRYQREGPQIDIEAT